MNTFECNRKYIENEFEEAVWDQSTGLTPEQLSLGLQAFQNGDSEEPRPMICAKAYAYLLDNVQLQINEHTPFSVKMNIGVDYTGFASTDIYDKELFQKQRHKILKRELPRDYNRMLEGDSVGLTTVWVDFWHTVPNWNFLLENGFSGILEKAKKSKKELLKNDHAESRRLVFLDSVILRFKAILRFIERVYEYSLHFDVSDFSAALRNLTKTPPQTLYEVMLFSVLYLYVEEIGCERARTLGPIDQLYLPFVLRDLENGKSIDEIKELFRYFFLHFTATKRFAEQPFTLCGCDKSGKDRTNMLSHLILDVYDELKIYDPKIHIRYHKNINKELFQKALSMIRSGHNSICILNDAAVFAGYEKLDVPREDAADYVVLGCYEPIIMGKEEGEVGVAWINAAKFIEFALNGGVDILTGKQIGYQSKTDFECFEDFLETYFSQMDYAVDFALHFAEKQSIYNTEINPSPIYSASFPECIENGLDVHEYPLKYNNLAIKLFGLATVVDSLVAIKKLVFDEGSISLEEFREILAKNWEGREDLRQRVLCDKDKYGNGLPLPDSIMTAITAHIEEKYTGKQFAHSRRLRIGLDSIDQCIWRGVRTVATPDGRRSGEPVSRNLCATLGMDRGGITAYMQSVLKINSAAFLNSAILDFTLHPSAIEGDKGLEDFCSLIKIFFAQGGFAVQGNVVSAETLKNALNEPNKYSTLQVRVCGWNEYFVKMSREKQELFIKRSEERNI
ncbi:MAG: hypothetical protein IJX80_00640 [Clostridia bacterium]|nr:hypothetical protein [Clostridia bacterium]